jgi:hypothetical protein
MLYLVVFKLDTRALGLSLNTDTRCFENRLTDLDGKTVSVIDMPP